MAGESVDSEAGGAFGEDGGVEGDDALKDESVRFALHVRWGAKVHGPRRVRCAVEVLGAGVAKVDLRGVDDGAVARFGLVVDDGGVGAGGGDGVEGEADEVLALGAEFVVLVYALDFVEFGFLDEKFFFEPSEVLAQGGAVADVALSHAFEFGCVFDGFGVADWATDFVGLVFAAEVEA